MPEAPSSNLQRPRPEAGLVEQPLRLPIIPRKKIFTTTVRPDQSAVALSLSGVSSKAPSLLPAVSRSEGVRFRGEVFAMNRSRCGYLFLFAAVALLAGSAKAALLTVKSGADSGGTCPGATCTLRQAIATANAGDYDQLRRGPTTKIDLTSHDELKIAKDLTISGPGANVLSVQRSAAAGTPTFPHFQYRWKHGHHL